MIRWGIAGTGGVSSLFANAVTASEGGEVVAVASRDKGRAFVFEAQHGIDGTGETYETLAARDDVDAVYVATPPALHHGDTIAYLDAGKHVLCEKPFATDAGWAQAMADAARENGRFLMEGMWCRFLPAYGYLRTLLAQRFCGDIVSIDASFGIKQPNRVRPEFNAALGGGALLTGGCYPIQLAHMILGEPYEVKAHGIVGDVDESFTALLCYPDGVTASVASSITTNLSCSARINGTDGVISLPSVHSPSAIFTETFAMPTHRLLPEVEHVQECIAAGLLESPIMPLSESVAIAVTMDKIRAQL